MKLCYLLMAFIGLACSKEEKKDTTFQQESADKFIIQDTLPASARNLIHNIHTYYANSSSGASIRDINLPMDSLFSFLRNQGNNLDPLDKYLLEVKVQNLLFNKQYAILEELLNKEDYATLQKYFIPNLMGANTYLTLPRQKLDSITDLVKKKVPTAKVLIASLENLNRFSSHTGQKLIKEDVQVETPIGETLSLKSRLSPGKKTVLLFGASWCSPCLKNDLLLTRWYTSIDTSKVTFINISVDKDKKAWKNILEKHHYPFENYRLTLESPEGKALYEALSLDKGVPKIFLLDQELNLLAFHINIIHILRNLPGAVTVKTDFY